MESNKLRRVPFLISIICSVTYGQEWPRLLFHTGETCAIPCLAQSEGKDFFWRKGDHYDASEEIAYNIAGSLYSSSVRHEVLSNGTLMIKNLTAEDEGKYFCRSVYSTSSCYTSVTVYVKVTVVPFIDLCSPRSSCTFYSKKDKTIPLTCTAKSVSSQMTLKWFNGSKEIVENVKITAGKNTRNETEISNKLTVTFQEASFFTCEAADVQLESAIAHVQLVPLEDDENSVGLIVAVSILAVTLCVALIATFYLILVKPSRQSKAASKSSEDGKKDERVPMLQEQLTKVEKDLEQERDKVSDANATAEAKEDALQATKKELQEKNQELNDLKEHLKTAQKRLKISMRDHEISKRELRFQFLSTKDVYRHLCLLKMPPGNFNEFAERNSSTILKVGEAKYNYNYIFEKNASNNDIYLQLEEFIQYAIDGGNSCILVLCSSTNDTASIVFDTENNADEGLIPKVIHTLFQMPSGWKEIGLTSGVTATYASVDSNGENKNASFEARKVPIESANHTFRFLKEFRDKQTAWDLSGQKKLAATNLFQFFIDTRVDEEVYSTGMLMFCTFTDVELIKSCLQGKTDGSTEFTKYVNSALNAPGTKMAILSVFSEGSKEAARYQLKFHEFINGAKKSFFPKFNLLGKKKEENA